MYLNKHLKFPIFGIQCFPSIFNTYLCTALHVPEIEANAILVFTNRKIHIVYVTSMIDKTLGYYCQYSTTLSYNFHRRRK